MPQTCLNPFFINSLSYKVELEVILTLYWMDINQVQKWQNCWLDITILLLYTTSYHLIMFMSIYA